MPVIEHVSLSFSAFRHVCRPDISVDSRRKGAQSPQLPLKNVCWPARGAHMGSERCQQVSAIIGKVRIEVDRLGGWQS